MQSLGISQSQEAVPFIIALINYLKLKTKSFIGKHLFPHMLQTTLLSLFFGPVELQSINLTFTFNITVSRYYHFELLLSGGQLIVL